MVRQYAVLCESLNRIPALDDFLTGHPSASPRQITDVILIDQSVRWRQGAGLPAEQYLDRFPDVDQNEDLRLEVVLAEYDYCSQYDEVDHQSFIRRFPEMQDIFEELLSERDSSHQFPTYSELIRRVFDEGSLLTTCWAATTIVRTTHERIRELGESGTVLGKCSPFEQLPAHVTKLIESHMFERTFRPGDHLMRQGESGDSLMVLCEGSVEISTDNTDGSSNFLTRTDKIQVLGEMSLLMEGERNANVVAETAVQTLVLPVATFHELASQYPAIRVVLSLLLSERLGHADRRDVLSGRTLQNYRILRRLGKGGMSVVYEAEDLDNDRQVALKMMSHRLVYNDEAQEQFQREADIVQSLKHPNIVQVYDRFSAFHTCFMVMQLCPGQTLYQIRTQYGKLPAELVRAILGQVAKALNHAHQAAVVHRDIKPGNIMVHSGQAQLMDFGLAMSDTDNREPLDALVGTPRYMAPEQLAGQRATQASDLFALGCVAYELLVDRPLFKDRTVARLLKVHANWPGLSDNMTSEIQDPQLLEFIRSALQKSPSQRKVDLSKLEAWAAPIDLNGLTPIK